MRNFGREEVRGHNERLEAYVEEQVSWQKAHPSETERQMKEFLKNQGIKYVFKKPMFYKPRGEQMKRYVIADFYIPDREIAINIGYTPYSRVDQYSELKYFDLCKANKVLKVLHWSASDFKLYSSMKSLVNRIK